MYNLIEYSNNHSKTWASVWKYYRGEPALTAAGIIDNFHTADNGASFKFKQKITSVTGDNGTKKFEIMVPLKCLSNFWKTLETPLINCEINRILIKIGNKLLNLLAKAFRKSFIINANFLYYDLVT